MIKDEDIDILVNGAFRVTEHVFQSKIVYTKNDKYYDKEHVYVDTVELKFYEATNGPTTTREWFEAGYIDSFSVQQANDPEGMKKYVYGENNEGSIIDVPSPYGTEYKSSILYSPTTASISSSNRIIFVR